MKKDKIHNPHDLFFQESWTNVSLVRSFLEEYLPPGIRSLICLDSLTICKDSFIEPDMREYYSDMLYQVRLEEYNGFLYFLFEHKSHPEKRIFLQLLRYMLSIWDLFLKQSDDPAKTMKLPIVIPLVVYHGKLSWNMPERFFQCFQGVSPDTMECIPDFRYLLHDLSRYTDDEIKGEVMTQITLRILKHAYDDNLLEKLPAIAKLFRELARKDTGLQYFETLLKYILNLGSLHSVSLAEIKSVFSDSLSKQQGELIMTIAEQLRQEGQMTGIEIGRKEGRIAGMEIGRQKGRQEGRKEERRKTALNLKSLGLSSDIIQQATGLSVAEIDQLDISERSDNISC